MPDLALFYLDALKITDKKNIDVLIQSAGAFIAAQILSRQGHQLKKLEIIFPKKL